MKKIFKALSLVLILMMMITLTSCQKGKIETVKPSEDFAKLKDKNEKYNKDNIKGYIDIDSIKDDKKIYIYIIRAIAKTEDGKFVDENGNVISDTDSKLEEKKYYIPSYSLDENKDENGNAIYEGFNKDENKYIPITLNTKGGKVLVPNISIGGKIFKGLFNENDERITEINPSHYVLEAKFITYGDAGLIALVCIVIVFLMLALIWGIVSLFRFLPKKKVKTDDKANQSQVIETKKVFTMADIKDDDMMAAALVATIDYHNETGENVRVVSVKQIG